MKNVDLTRIHYLSGPFEIETAEPGDVLIVEICDVQPHEDHPWGFTGLWLLKHLGGCLKTDSIGVFDKNNGGGFLDEIYPTA